MNFKLHGSSTTPKTSIAPVAVITGASRGLGLALTTSLVSDGWTVVGDGRDSARLTAAFAPIGEAAVAVPGDIGADSHRRAVRDAVDKLGRCDLLVHNAGGLGAVPLPPLAAYPIGTLTELLAETIAAPLALTQLLLPTLRRDSATVVAISSDAAREAYPTWGGYAAAKAGLEQLFAVLAVEEPRLTVQVIDPGDLRTELHQAAFPGEDISDRPLPEAAIPALRQLLGGPGGRHRAAELVTS